jgi:rubrerythrin
VADTRTNLMKALEFEIQQIDVLYPQYVKQVETEKHPAAAGTVRNAWNAEKQHRDLLSRVLTGADRYFEAIAAAYEASAVAYFVCQNCGSFLLGGDLPKDSCPICGFPASQFRRIEPAR